METQKAQSLTANKKAQNRKAGFFPDLVVSSLVRFESSLLCLLWFPFVAAGDQSSIERIYIAADRS
jgi:hypothetical protein